MLVADRVYRNCFNGGALTPTRNDARLAARMAEVRDALLAECARWGYRTPANWEAAASTVRTSLFPARTGQLVNLLRGRGLYPRIDPPAFDAYGGIVTNGFQPRLTATGGTIYYTLDGTDPRLPGGAISPQARVWTTGGVSLASNVVLNARVRANDGTWSALAQPGYRVAPVLALAVRAEAGTVRLAFSGLGGEAYQIQTATDLANPVWSLLQEIRPPTDGKVETSDLPGNNGVARFYRVQWAR
jgi:hypothetical protein